MGLKLSYIGMPKSQQYDNPWVSRDATSIAPKGTKAKSASELAAGNATTCSCTHSCTQPQSSGVAWLGLRLQRSLSVSRGVRFKSV
jgi:hypothetical protein